jgi:Fe-S cluster biogenesis protein NfuA
MSERVATITDPAITIRAEPSPLDASLCKFTVNRVIHSGGPFLFDSKEAAEGSPLAEAIFRISGIATILVAENVVSVTKNTNTSWLQLMKPIGAAIRNQLTSGAPAILSLRPTRLVDAHTDAELKRLAQELLDREINPSVASHGGKISVVDVKNADLFIAMSGGCQGCAASQLTLRQGVEVMFRRVLPQVREIIDSTDHSAGTQPFYKNDT